MSRYTYITARTYEKAEDMLEEAFACGEVSLGEQPRIERRRDRHEKIYYVVTLLG